MTSSAVLGIAAIAMARPAAAPILRTWTWDLGSGERQLNVTSTGSDTYAGAYLAGVDDCGKSLGGYVAWHITGSGMTYTGSSEWLQTSPECQNIGPGEATWTLESDTTRTYCSTSPNREVVNDCTAMTKSNPHRLPHRQATGASCQGKRHRHRGRPGVDRRRVRPVANAADATACLVERGASAGAVAISGLGCPLP